MFQKNHAKVGGRKKGSENKDTAKIRDAYKMLIENNLDNLTKWLEKIAEKDPAKAINILAELSEFVLPKLARTEVDSTIDVEINQFKVSDIISFETNTTESEI